MDHTVRVCRCFGPKPDASRCLHGCMGPTANLPRAGCCPQRSDVATKKLKVLLQNPERVRGPKPSNRLPLLSPPQMGGYARGRQHPAINSVDASGGESRISTRRRMSQRGCPRHNAFLCSSNSVERLNPPRTTSARAPPRLLGGISSEEQATVPPLSTLSVTTGAVEGERTKEENTHPGQNKTKTGIDRNVGEQSSRFSEGRDLHSGVSLKSFRSTVSVDLLGSANSIDSMQSLGSPNSVVSMQSLDSAHSINSTESFRARALAREGFPQDSAFAEAGSRGATLAANEQATEELRTVEETICESWKELPWQARLCPRAIEEREDFRRACALEKESQRVHAWRQEQQILTSNAAREEERKLAGWWKAQAKKIWKFESQRRRCRERLATDHEAQISALESQRINLIGTGYGQELATLAEMDHSEHVERMSRIKTVLALIPRTAEPVSERASSASGSVELNTTLTVTPGITREGRNRHELSQEDIDDCVARISAQALFELEQVKMSASESAAVARLSSRRRQSLAYLTYAGLGALYRGARARAMRAFVSECAADVARVKQLASVVGKTGKTGPSEGETGGCPGALGDVCCYAADGEVVGPDAAWDREKRRVTAEIEGEASRVACWTRLQREVFRRSTADVLRLLVADSQRGPPIDGSGVWSWGSRKAGAGAGGGGGEGGADSIVAVRKRRRVVLHELKRRQVEVSAEAESFRRSWMASLAHWKAQLGRAQHTAVKRKAAELRVLQRRNAEAAAIREDIATSALAKRGETQGYSWGVVLESEVLRINDAAGAWRHCFLAASDKLKGLVEGARRERLRAAESWKEKTARASDRSRALASAIENEQGRLEDERSSLVADLVQIVAENTAKDTEVAVEASRVWWAEASTGLAMLLSGCLGDARDCEEGGYQKQCRTDFSQGRSGDCEGREDLPRDPPSNVGAVAGGGVGFTENAAPAAAAAPSAALLVARLDNINRAEGLRCANAVADIVAESGPLRLAVAATQLRQSNAIERCEHALARADGDSPRAHAAAGALAAEAPPPTAAAVLAPPTGECGGGGGVQPAEELDWFREKLETDTVELVAASFEEEVRRLAIGEKGDIPSPAIGACLTLPDDPPRELTRSQLDLRRAAEIRAYARSLGGMLLRARRGLAEKMLQASSADQEKHDRDVSTAQSSHLHQLDQLKEKARVDTDEALQAALAEARSLAKGASERSRVVNEARLLVINVVVGWVDQAESVDLNASERRRRKREGWVASRTASMADFDQTVSEEQRDWLCRVSDRGEEAVAAGRVAVAEQVAEIIRGRWRDEEGGGGLVVPVNRNDGADFHPTSTTTAAVRPGTLFGGETEGEQLNAVARIDAPSTGGMEELLSVEDGVTGHEESDNRSARDHQAEQASEETKVGGVVADGNGPGDKVHDDTSFISPQTDNIAPPVPPSLDELQVEPFLAVQAAAEASCSADIDAWAGEARSRAQTLADNLYSEAVSDDNEERLAVETEWKTLQLAFRAAQKEAEAAAAASWRAWGAGCGGGGGGGGGGGIQSPNKVENTSGTEETERGISSGGFDDSVPIFAVKEQKECTRHWARLEQPLAFRIQTATKHAGIRMSDEAKSAGDEAMARVTELEAALRSALKDMAATGDNDVRAAVAAGRENLRLVFVQAKEEEQLHLAFVLIGITSAGV